MYKRVKDLGNFYNDDSIENYNTDTTLDLTDF